MKQIPRLRLILSGLAAAFVPGAALVAPAPAAAQWFGVYERYERPFIERRWVEPEWEEPGWRSRRGPRVVIEDDVLTAGEVARLLRRQGLRPVGPVRRIGERYRVDVQDRAGRRLRALVDAYEGDIVNLSQRASLPDTVAPNTREPGTRESGTREPAIIPAPRNAAPLPPVRPPVQTSAVPRTVPALPGPVALPKIAAPGPARAAVIEVDPVPEVDPSPEVPAVAPLD